MVYEVALVYAEGRETCTVQDVEHVETTEQVTIFRDGKGDALLIVTHDALLYAQRISLGRGAINMKLTHQHIENTFDAAREVGAKYVFVAVVAEGIEEIIVIPRESWEAKEVFYKRSYSNEGLVHVMNSQVYIRGLSYGDADELNNIV